MTDSLFITLGFTLLLFYFISLDLKLIIILVFTKYVQRVHTQGSGEKNKLFPHPAHKIIQIMKESIYYPKCINITMTAIRSLQLQLHNKHCH